MKFWRNIGIYLLGMISIMLVGALWQLKCGSGYADFSFLFLMPLAAGLLWGRRWAIWGTGALGIISVTILIGMVLVCSVLGTTGVTLGVGPVVMTQPKVLSLWLFALTYIVLLGIPMMSVLAKWW